MIGVMGIAYIKANEGVCIVAGCFFSFASGSTVHHGGSCHGHQKSKYANMALLI